MALALRNFFLMGSDWPVFGRMKVQDRRSYDNIKAIGRINGTLLLIGLPVCMIAATNPKGQPLWEILLGVGIMGAMWYAVFRWWKSSWRKD